MQPVSRGGLASGPCGSMVYTCMKRLALTLCIALLPLASSAADAEPDAFKLAVRYNEAMSYLDKLAEDLNQAAATARQLGEDDVAQYFALRYQSTRLTLRYVSENGQCLNDAEPAACRSIVAADFLAARDKIGPGKSAVAELAKKVGSKTAVYFTRDEKAVASEWAAFAKDLKLQ